MKCRVEVTKKFPEIELVGRSIGPSVEGEEILLRFWEVPIFERRGLVEPVSDFSVVGLRKRLMAERKTSQLGDIPNSFYRMIEARIERLRSEGRDEEVERIKDVLSSIINLRVQKIAKIVTSSVSPGDIPPEEKILANRLSKALAVWRERLDRHLELSKNEEVGAPEQGIRRSIQRIVRNTTDI